jgi:polysaccharide deacetylase 2 family uncharacterized protein YibQ
VPVAKAKIAIVIDDWGYNLNNINILDEIKLPLTASVLPNLTYSNKIAQELQSRGFEVILHLPLEPREKYKLEKNTILISFKEDAIINIIKKDLANIVYAKGVSNHMGSAATGDLHTMETIFKELKKRRLYFLDSFVSGQSICFALAKKIGLPFAKRDIFLDNRVESGYIRAQLYKLKQKARLYGQAIGIGHDRKVTLEVLRDVMPQFVQEGYQFVFVSQILR